MKISYDDLKNKPSKRISARIAKNVTIILSSGKEVHVTKIRGAGGICYDGILLGSDWQEYNASMTLIGL